MTAFIAAAIFYYVFNLAGSFHNGKGREKNWRTTDSENMNGEKEKDI